MPVFLQEFITLLIKPPGNLIYYLVLSFCVAAALPAAINHWRSSGSGLGMRMVIGLLPILLALLFYFLVGGLAWQGLLPEHSLLPPIDRAIALFSLTLIIWLWTFPESLRPADAAFLLLTLLTLTLSALNIAWWFAQGGQIHYNATLLDRTAQGYALLLILVGSVLLLIRRPNGWSYGFPMLFLLFLGHLAQLIFPDATGDYAGPVRLAQMAAFPILIALPQRFPNLGDTRRESSPFSSAEARRPTADPRLVQSLLTLASETRLSQVYQELTCAISITMLADYCLLISPPDDDWQMSILSCYDLIREEYHQVAKLDGRQAPVIAAAMRHSRPLRLPESKNAPDLVKLAQAINVERTGHLLAVPISDSDGNLICGVFLLSPYSNHTWSNEDQSQLSSLAKPLAQLLQHNHKLADLYAERVQMQSTIQTAQAKTAQLQQENEALLFKLKSFPHRADVNQAASVEVEALLAAQEQAKETIARLQSENELLQKERSRPIPLAYNEPTPQGAETLEGELRLALEEISRLRSAQTGLTEAPSASAPGFPAPTATPGNKLTTLAQELRQPVSSIVSYTDFLFGESVGILDTLQRKFLEHIKIAAERMSTILDDMVHATNVETTTLRLNPEPVKLSDIIKQAVLKTSDQIRQKDITFRMHMPEILPRLMADPGALEQVIISLLENASKVTPQQGQISLRVETRGEGIDQGFVLLQVADQGGGIAPEDISHVFSRLNHTAVPGAGDSGAGLSIIKALVEALEGRIWIDCQPEVGTVFSVLMPVLSTKSTPDEGKD
jgi:signal transduction histidine kinase